MNNLSTRIESELEVKAYIQNLKYALSNGATIQFQVQRYVDEKRDTKYTNRFTVDDIFPNEEYHDMLKRELMTLTPANYIRTVKDFRFPNKGEMREFGKYYEGYGDVYIKVRVELLGIYGNSTVFVMSFHYSEIPFITTTFPYSVREGDKNENSK